MHPVDAETYGLIGNRVISSVVDAARMHVAFYKPRLCLLLLLILSDFVDVLKPAENSRQKRF